MVIKDLFICTEVYHEIITGQRLNLVKDFPQFKVKRNVKDENKDDTHSDGCSLLTTLEELNLNIQKCWSLENINMNNAHSIKEREWESHYCNTVRRDDNGRYVVNLPLKIKVSELGDGF